MTEEKPVLEREWKDVRKLLLGDNFLRVNDGPLESLPLEASKRVTCVGCNFRGYGHLWMTAFTVEAVERPLTCRLFRRSVPPLKTKEGEVVIPARERWRLVCHQIPELAVW